jgi:hypothetical protein
MGSQLRYGTAGATGGGFSHQPGSHQFTFGDQYYPKWDRGGAISPRTWKDKNWWYSLWSYGCRTGMGGGGNDGEGSRGLSYPDLFEPFSCDGEGTQTKRFIKGTCVDSVDAPVANAIVQGFVTATDAYVGEVTANNDGTYTLGTETIAGVQHYLVAYKPGSPDIAGTTVNTLTSTNVDGT